MKSQQISYLYQSVSDIQNTIRAIDVKLGFLFVAIFLPVVAVPKIYLIYNEIKHIAFYDISSLLLLLLWCSSLYFLFKSLVSIKNPVSGIENIEMSNKCSFYNGDLFKLDKIDLFFNFPIKSKKTVSIKCEELPQNEDEIISSLMYESFKLSYIRDLKIARSTICTYCIFLTISLGTLIWCLSIFKVGL